MRGIFATLAIVWRIASPFFLRAEERWPGRILLATIIAIELSIVGVTVLFNTWHLAFYNALQDRNWDAFVHQLGYFCVLAAAFITLAVYQLYLNQWLQIRWRRWLTATYLDHWLAGANHYRMQLLGDAADNPDQRIANDIALFIQLTLGIGLQLLNSVVTLFSFMVIGCPRARSSRSATGRRCSPSTGAISRSRRKATDIGCKTRPSPPPRRRRRQSEAATCSDR